MPDEKIIKRYMNSLSIGREEAIQLWKDDQADEIGEAGEEMTRKAKATQHREKSFTPRKESKPKERKVDPDKKYLFDLVRQLMEDQVDVGPVKTKTETELTFVYNAATYTWKLTKHRPQK